MGVLIVRDELLQDRQHSEVRAPQVPEMHFLSVVHGSHCFSSYDQQTTPHGDIEPAVEFSCKGRMDQARIGIDHKHHQQDAGNGRHNRVAAPVDVGREQRW